MSKKNKKKMNNKTKQIIILFSLVLVVGIGFFITSSMKEDTNPKKEEDNKTENKVPEKEEVTPEKKLSIINEDSTTRPIGVMIDNVKGAWPQAGINDAYLTYEITVEGGLTRLFALFKDKDVSMIGPVRSLRHYYIDYQKENDSILTHFGHSPKALSDIGTYNVPSINGIYVGIFWRDSSLTNAPHNAFTSTKKITDYAEKKGYNKSVSDTLLNYSVDEINLDTIDGVINAGEVNIRYSNNTNVYYQYDSLQKKYLKTINSEQIKDRNTNERLTVKNIIVINVKNFNLGDGSGRQDLSNITSGNGYYITNGNAVKIKYEKTSKEGKTKYMHLNGEEIKVNDGNTYIQIQPINEVTTFK